MPEDWDNYVAGFHDSNPGVTEDVLSDARDDAGRSPYDWLLDAVPAGVGTVVDLACGSGPIARRLDVPLVVGVDQSAGELARAAGPRVQARATALPLTTGCAGAVVSSMALMLLHPLERTLAEVARVLRRQGAFVATVPVRRRSAGTEVFADLLRTLGQSSFDYPEPLDRDVGERFAGVGMDLCRDEIGVFIRTVRREDAEPVVRSFYAPGAGPEKVAAAVGKLEAVTPVEVGYPIRRLVGRR
jgi:SAM-dependent methyltransferase